MVIARDDALEMYRRIVRIRRFEEAASEAIATGEVAGGVHTSIGQEAAVVGACHALRTSDHVLGTHRSHGHPIAKGAALPTLMAELFGRVTGVCHGKGGSMHLADFSIGCLGESSIVGSGIPVAVGAALSSKMRGTDQVTVSFFGDGAMNEGACHEAMNLAAIWDLPVVFFCENNQYAVTMSVHDAVRVARLSDRAAAYGFTGVTVDGQDVVAVLDVMLPAIERARSGGGPTLVEAITYRYREHGEGLHFDGSYRTDEEIAEWRTKDPITVAEHRFESLFPGIEADLRAVAAEVVDEVDQALRFARDSDLPGPDELFTDLYR